jgi:hypothetical protein
MQNMRFTLPEIAASVRDLGYRGKELFSDGYSCVATSPRTISSWSFESNSSSFRGAFSSVATLDLTRGLLSLAFSSSDLAIFHS